jgi:hypothetical protein
MRLQQQGYRIWTQAIAADITPKNRLLIGRPLDAETRDTGRERSHAWGG